MSQERIIEKIRKCLALSKSSNEHEAELALLRAQKLAMSHGLKLADIKSSPEDKGITFRVFMEHYLRRRMASGFITAIIEEFFAVEMFFQRGLLGIENVIIGLPHNIEIAWHVYLFLHDEYPRRYRAYVRKTGKELYADRHSFYRGVNVGLSEKLSKNEENFCREHERYALVKADQAKEIKSFVAEFFGQVQCVPNRKHDSHKDSLVAGYYAGKDIEIHSALEESKNDCGRLN